MSEKALAQSIVQLIKGMKRCLENDLMLPCLMLIYSGIDIGAWLSSNDPSESVQNGFIRWSDKYIDPENKFNCSSLDLYSARCGLLHRLNSDSRISERGDAKRIAYYTNDEVTIVEEAIKKFNKSDKYASIRVEYFIEVFQGGMLSFLSDSLKDPLIYDMLKRKAERSFMIHDGPFDNCEIAIDK